MTDKNVLVCKVPIPGWYEEDMCLDQYPGITIKLSSKPDKNGYIKVIGGRLSSNIESIKKRCTICEYRQRIPGKLYCEDCEKILEALGYNFLAWRLVDNTKEFQCAICNRTKGPHVGYWHPHLSSTWGSTEKVCQSCFVNIIIWLLRGYVYNIKKIKEKRIVGNLFITALNSLLWGEITPWILKELAAIYCEAKEELDRQNKK